MDNTQRYFLKKEDRLKSRKLIDLLFREGNQFSMFPFRVLWMKDAGTSSLQAGVGVSSRNFKKAVDRNRIKRLMRESYRLQKNRLSEKLLSTGSKMSVFILYTGKEMPEYEIIFEKMGSTISRLIKHADENDQ